MNNFKPGSQGVSIDTCSYSLNRVVGRHVQLIIDKRYLASFSLSGLVVPWIGPEFKVINYTLASLGSYVVNNHSVLALVAVPPLVNSLNVVVLFSGSTGLPCSRVSPEPIAFLRVLSLRDNLVVFKYPTYLVIASYSNVSRNLLELSFLGMVPYLVPVCFHLLGSRPLSYLDGSF